MLTFVDSAIAASPQQRSNLEVPQYSSIRARLQQRRHTAQPVVHASHTTAGAGSCAKGLRRHARAVCAGITPAALQCAAASAKTVLPRQHPTTAAECLTVVPGAGWCVEAL